MESYAGGDGIGGKYRLERLLEQGGMGSVWVARNIALDVDVAIKLIRRDLTLQDAPLRLLHEARAAACLEHPSIVRVFDFGETEAGDPYIVMELLHGQSLADVLDRRARLSATEAVRVLLPILSALCVAHAKGIIHRDIKPENVFLAESPGDRVVPKLVDFGVAKLRRAPRARRTTDSGVVIGSPEYMSPEQARGGDVDETTDVWSLAVVLYEAITGERPFTGDTYNAQISAVLLDDPEPIASYAAGDDELWEIIERALHKDAAERWPSARHFGTALARWALARGVESDLCGVSLRAEWLDRTPGRDVEAVPAIEGRATAAPPMVALEERPRSSSDPAPATVALSDVPPAPRSPRPVRTTLGVLALVGVVVGSWVAGLLPAQLHEARLSMPAFGGEPDERSSASATMAAPQPAANVQPQRAVAPSKPSAEPTEAAVVPASPAALPPPEAPKPRPKTVVSARPAARRAVPPASAAPAVAPAPAATASARSDPFELKDPFD